MQNVEQNRKSNPLQPDWVSTVFSTFFGAWLGPIVFNSDHFDCYFIGYLAKQPLLAYSLFLNLHCQDFTVDENAKVAYGVAVDSPKILADIFESVAGAILSDSDSKKAVWEFFSVPTTSIG